MVKTQNSEHSGCEKAPELCRHVRFCPVETNNEAVCSCQAQPTKEDSLWCPCMHEQIVGAVYGVYGWSVCVAESLGQRRQG